MDPALSAEPRLRAIDHLCRAFALGSLIAWIVLMVAAMPYVGSTLIGTLQTIPALSPTAGPEAAEGAQAIVVLSAGSRVDSPDYPGDTVDALGLERVRYAALLARRFNLPVLVSGGTGVIGHATLAAELKSVLQGDYGLPPPLVEDRSATTLENARFSAALLKAKGITKVVLVTHAWHMPRARDAMLAQGIEVVCAPTAFTARAPLELRAFAPNVNALRLTSYAVHEWVGRVWYREAYGIPWT